MIKIIVLILLSIPALSVIMSFILTILATLMISSDADDKIDEYYKNKN